VAAPSGLTGQAVGTTGINLAWTDNANERDGFRVGAAAAPAARPSRRSDEPGANAAAFSDTGLTASTSYSYRVARFNADRFVLHGIPRNGDDGPGTGSPSFVRLRR